MSPLEGDKEQVKSESKESIAEGVKLNHRKRKKNRNRIKNINTKQTINQASNIISTNKSCKQLRPFFLFSFFVPF